MIDLNKMREGMRMIREATGADEQDLYLVLEDKLFFRVGNALATGSASSFTALELYGVLLGMMGGIFKPKSDQ